MLVDTNGTQLHVQEDSTAGEALVFLHHGMGRLEFWDPVVPFIADRCRVIQLDLRGHGRSAKPAGCSPWRWRG